MIEARLLRNQEKPERAYRKREKEFEEAIGQLRAIPLLLVDSLGAEDAESEARGMVTNPCGGRILAETAA